MKLKTLGTQIVMLMVGVCEVLRAQAPTGVGALSGRVVDAEGKTIVGAVVHYRKLDNLVRDCDRSLRALPPFVNDTGSTGA